MTGHLLPVSAGLLLVVLFLSQLAAYSLRDFSRSRLELFCRRKARHECFGVILKRHDDARLSAELLSAVTFVGFVLVATVWLALLPPRAEAFSPWAAYVLRMIAFLIVGVLALVMLPWTVSRVTGERFLYYFWPVLLMLSAIARPYLAVTRKIDKFAHRMAGLREPAEGDAALINAEIHAVIDEGQREGVIQTETRAMIYRVVELQDEDVSSIMTPRTDMVCIPEDSTLDEARQVLLDAGHSRVPVIGESTDEIVGILYAKDLLMHLHANNGQAAGLRDIVREPFYTPETTGVDKLLDTMKRQHVQLAIVVDEYGGVAGLVTMEDILEEIVGEIVDEYDRAEEEGIWPISPEVTDVEARVHIDDLNERFNYELPEDGDFDTVGGFVFNQLGRIPEPRETFTWSQLRFTVLAADRRKIHKLRIEIDRSLAEAPAEEG